MSSSKRIVINGKVYEEVEYVDDKIPAKTMVEIEKYISDGMYIDYSFVYDLRIRFNCECAHKFCLHPDIKTALTMPDICKEISIVDHFGMEVCRFNIENAALTEDDKRHICLFLDQEHLNFQKRSEERNGYAKKKNAESIKFLEDKCKELGISMEELIERYNKYHQDRFKDDY